MSEQSSDEQLRDALEQQREAWIDHEVDEETRLQRIDRATSRIEAIMSGREIPAVPDQDVEPVVTPQERLQLLFVEESAARRRGDHVAVQRLNQEIIDINATINRPEPPQSE